MPGLRSCHSPALGLWLKVESSVWCGDSQRGEKRAALTAKVGILVKKKKKSQSMLEGSRRGELVYKQIPKADGAGRLYWGEMPSALTQKL